VEGQTSSLRRREPPLHSPGGSIVPATSEYIAGATGNVVDVVEVADSDGNGGDRQRERYQHRAPAPFRLLGSHRRYLSCAGAGRNIPSLVRSKEGQSLTRILRCLAVLALAGCSPSPTDFASGFTGGWVGTTSVTIQGQTSNEDNTLFIIASTGIDSLEIENLCGDGSGPPATVTSETAFTAGQGSCPPEPVSGCSSVTLSTTDGSGQLGTLSLTMTLNGSLSGCGQSFPISIIFSGTRMGSSPPDAGSSQPDGGQQLDSGTP
jgi:hypothetical protein